MPPPGSATGTYQNWHANLPAKSVSWWTPRNAREAGNAIAHCQEAGERLLVVGSRFSLSRLVEAAPNVMNAELFRGAKKLTDAYRKKPGGKNGFFWVGGGTYLTDLNLELGRLGWALPTSGAASNQSIAGATSTGTHGASTYGAVHDAIRAVCLVTGPDTAVLVQPSGRPFTDALKKLAEKETGLTVKEPPKELADTVFGAAMVGLGALGVIHSLVLEVEPLYSLVGHWRDSPLPDDTLDEAVRTDDFRGLWERPDTAPPGAAPFNVAITYSPYGWEGHEPDFSRTKAAFANFLWKTKAHKPYPKARPTGKQRIGSAFERAVVASSNVLKDGLVGHIVAANYRAGDGDPSTPVFPGWAFGPTGIPASWGRSTEIFVEAKDAKVAIDALLATLRDHPRRVVGLVGVRWVGATKNALLGMNQRRVACLELPCLAVDDEGVGVVYEACWRRIAELGIRHTYHWGQECPAWHDEVRLRSWYGDANVDGWKVARDWLLSPAARKVFRSPLTDQVGLTSA